MLVNWQLQALIEQGLVNEWKNDSDEWKKISWRNLHNAGQRISSWSAFMPNTGLEKVFKGPSSANSGHPSFSLNHLVKVTKQLCPALLPGALLNITFENTLFNAKCFFFFPSMHENKRIGPLRERLGVSASPRYFLKQRKGGIQRCSELTDTHKPKGPAQTQTQLEEYLLLSSFPLSTCTGYVAGSQHLPYKWTTVSQCSFPMYYLLTHSSLAAREWEHISQGSEPEASRK